MSKRRPGITGHGIRGADCQHKRIAKTLVCAMVCEQCLKPMRNGEEVVIVSRATVSNRRMVREAVHRVMHNACIKQGGG